MIKAPKVGEKWTIGAYKDLVFLGVGFNFEKEKHFIFSDPIDGLFLIKKDEFYNSELRKECQ